MENYVLYDEIGRGEHSVVYKGRKKGTVEFVAIHCVDKCKRLELRNTVRITHDLEHPNVVRFHEWYETTNHIWMVVELCTGYSLEVLMSQDKIIPEETVQQFGKEIIKALFYLHSLGVLYCDLKLSKILLDGPGHLKLSDFALSCVEGEDDIFDLESDADDNTSSYDAHTTKDKRRPKPSPYYMAPEVLMGSPPSKDSDLWSFGCLLFELFTGKLPFMADSLEILAEKVLGDPCPDINQVVDGKTVYGSDSLKSVINGLLVKDPPQRLDWSELIKHPFWENSLHSLLDHKAQGSEEDLRSVCDENPRDIIIETALEDVIEDNINNEQNDLNENESGNSGIKMGTYTFQSKPHEITRAKVIQSEERNRRPGEQCHNENNLEEFRNGKQNIQSNKTNEQSGTFLRENKGSLSVEREQTVVLSKKNSLAVKSSSSEKESKVTSNINKDSAVISTVSSQDDALSPNTMDLIYHPSDFVVTPIIDNLKIKKISMPRFDPKAVCCQVLKPEEIPDLSDEDFTEHLKSIEQLFSPNQKNSGNAAFVQRSKLHTAAYLASLCRHGDIANMIFESNLVSTMLYQVKNGFSVELKSRIGYCLGLLAGSATLISEDFNLTEVFTVLTEVIRDNFRNIQLKQHLVPALGEFLFYASTQEETENRQIAKWDVPAITFVIFTRCLRDGEDIYVQHFAAKAIDNVASTKGRHCAKFAANDTSQLLWNLFTHCTVDNQKVTAISALCRLTCHSVGVFQYVLEKAGSNTVQDSLSSGIPQVQQAALTMFASLLSSKPHAKRLIQEKVLISKVMHMLESHSAVIRGKAFLLLAAMMQCNRETVLMCCQNRLVLHIEKDQKRGTPMKGEVPETRLYLMHCLQKCIECVVELALNILESALASLNAVEGRRHPSAAHTKQLRIHLPNLTVILHLITSHVFRSLTITPGFLADVGLLLSHVKSIDCGNTSLGTAAGPSAEEDLTYVVLSVVECITQHPPLLLEYANSISVNILPVLVELVNSSNGNTRVLSFRLFSEVASLYLDNQNVYNSASNADSVISSTNKLNEVISNNLLPQYHTILQDQNPLPAYGLKLLSSLQDRCPNILQDFLNQDLILSFLHIVNSQANAGNVTMTTAIINLLSHVLMSKDVDMTILYQQGLIDGVKSLFTEVNTTLYNADSSDSEDASAMIVPFLDTLTIILKYVSKEVRHALLDKSKGLATQTAEALLIDTKPLADVTGLLISLLGNQDDKVQERACKILYLVAELFGGLYEDAMSEDNVRHFAVALETTDENQQKQLLRIIKRMISSNANHSKSIITHGQPLIDVFNKLEACPKAVAVQTLAKEILHKIEVAS